MTCAPDRGVCAQPTTIRLEALFLLLIDTGLRPGEALALGWSDLDLDASWLRVERGLGRRRMGEPWRFEAPKTSGSRRTVPLPATIIRALRAHRAGQAEERLAAGSSYADLDLAFATPLGGPLDGRNVVNRHFKPMLLRAGLPATVRLYDLRHSAATHMLAGGASVRAVADRLGHASAKMTLDVYAHALPAQIDETTAILERALGGD
jgi:integrase